MDGAFAAGGVSVGGTAFGVGVRPGVAGRGDAGAGGKGVMVWVGNVAIGDGAAGFAMALAEGVTMDGVPVMATR